MDLNEEAKELCREYGGFWNFVEKVDFNIHFVMEHKEAVDSIIYELREFECLQYLLKENYLGSDDKPPRYDIETVKKVLKEEIPEGISDNHLRLFAFEKFVQELKDQVESYVNE